MGVATTATAARLPANFVMTKANCHRFSDLTGPDVAKTEQKAEWPVPQKCWLGKVDLTKVAADSTVTDGEH